MRYSTLVWTNIYLVIPARKSEFFPTVAVLIWRHCVNRAAGIFERRFLCFLLLVNSTCKLRLLFWSNDWKPGAGGSSVHLRDAAGLQLNMAQVLLSRVLSFCRLPTRLFCSHATSPLTIREQEDGIRFTLQFIPIYTTITNDIPHTQEGENINILTIFGSQNVPVTFPKGLFGCPFNSSWFF